MKSKLTCSRQIQKGLHLEHESFEARSRSNIWDRITNIQQNHKQTETQTEPGIELLCN